MSQPDKLDLARRVFTQFQEEYEKHPDAGVQWWITYETEEDRPAGMSEDEFQRGLSVLRQKRLLKPMGMDGWQLTDEGSEACLHPELLEEFLGPGRPMFVPVESAPPKAADAPKTDDSRNKRAVEVFVSWSGSAARAVALELKQWLPAVIQGIDVWVSEVDIAAGSVWREEVKAAFRRAAYCIVCVTGESVISPWVNYEAGAIHEGFGKPVCPYLIGVDMSALQNMPLSNLQAVPATHDGTVRLLRALNQTIAAPLAAQVLERSCSAHWPTLEKVITHNAATVNLQPKVVFEAGMTDEDAINMVRAWIRNRPDAENHELFVFADIDRRFGFAGGTTKRVLPLALGPTSLEIESQTERTALLKWKRLVRGSSRTQGY